jgi:uncharacterized membrane protein YfcA
VTGHDTLSYALLGLAALLAGGVDAVIGGGGMVQVPALFALFPAAAPASLFGINKIASAIGTLGAGFHYARATAASWRLISPLAAAAFLASILGALAVLAVPAEPLRKALPFILLALLVFMLAGDAGLDHAPKHGPRKEIAVGCAGTALIGAYDGFFGPGAGAFYKLFVVRGLGYDFVNAAAPAKIANVASNFGALIVFIATVKIEWALAGWIALLNFAGGQIGSRIAFRQGSRFIRKAFIAVVACLIVKTFMDGYGR